MLSRVISPRIAIAKAKFHILILDKELVVLAIKQFWAQNKSLYCHSASVVGNIFTTNLLNT